MASETPTSITLSVQYTDTPWTPITLPSYPFLGDTSKDFGEHIAGEMSMVHNIIIRSLNAIWLNAPLVTSPSTTKAFVGYVLAAIAFLHEHHEIEETIMFPALVGQLDMNDNLEQHKVFMTPLEEFEAYIAKVKSKEEEYDAEKTRTLLKALGDPLVHHLTEEISTIQPNDMKQVDREILDQVAKDIAVHVQANGTLSMSLPFLLTAHKTSDSPNWPPLPSILRWLTKNAFYRINSSYWKFAPYTPSGEPQHYSSS